MDRNIKVTLLPKQIEIIGDGITAQILAAHHKDLNRNAAGEVLDRARGEVHGFNMSFTARLHVAKRSDALWRSDFIPQTVLALEGFLLTL